MYCSNCGNEVSEKAVICLKCGAPVNENGSVIVTDEKDWLTALLLCIFLGYLGIHRFYTKNTAIAVVQLLTLGCCGIWTLIDFILILAGSYTDGNGKHLVKK
jgi:TM2 domain-containing membrane protein YozV